MKKLTRKQQNNFSSLSSTSECSLNRGKKIGIKGQSIIEYIILTSLIGIISIVAVKNLGGVLQRRINLIKEEIVRIIPND